MNSSTNDLCALAKSLGAVHAAIISVEDIQFNDDFRKQCEQNVCGSYNKNWMCPPHVASINDLKDKVLQYEQGLLFQTVFQLKSSFDWKGMQQSIADHTQVFRSVLGKMRTMEAIKALLPLNVGPCTYCGRCSLLDGEECRFPEVAVVSVEAFGIDVMALEKSCGMPYYNGPNTVSCVSLILFNTDERHPNGI